MVVGAAGVVSLGNSDNLWENELIIRQEGAVDIHGRSPYNRSIFKSFVKPYRQLIRSRR